MRSLLSILLLAFSSLAPAQDPAKGDALRALAWQRGSAEGRIADKASIQIPQGYVFLDAPNTKRFLEIAGNPPRDGHYMIAPETLSWFAFTQAISSLRSLAGTPFLLTTSCGLFAISDIGAKSLSTS